VFTAQIPHKNGPNLNPNPISQAQRLRHGRRLARYFGASAEMWAGLQSDYDLRQARCENKRIIERKVEPLAA
jgi:hypothetical protein